MDKKIFALLNCICLCSYAVGLPTTGSLQAVTVRKCGTSILPPSSPDRIVGGNTVRHGQYPWMISLQKDEGDGFKHNCGGAILNENWIITAAHCVYFNRGKPSMFRILAGLHKVSQEYASTVQHIKISEIVVHEDYRDPFTGNDIALLKVDKPIDIAGSKGYVNGICLPNADEDPTGYATVIGWGDTKKDGKNSDTLREVALPIVSKDSCQKSYIKFYTILPNMICAGVTGKDSCQNDSGGPLFQTNSKGESTLIGITSFGIGCGDRNFPGIYTKVSSHQSWIENITATH